MSVFNKDRAAEWLKERIRGFFAGRQILLIHYTGPERDGWIQRVNQVKAERKSLLSHGDMCQIIAAVHATRHIPGDMVEFGVAYGASARIIGEYGAGRTLHLFDTFSGLPKPGVHDSSRFYEGSYSCSLESVQQYVAGLPCRFFLESTKITPLSFTSTSIFTKARWKASSSSIPECRAERF